MLLQKCRNIRKGDRMRFVGGLPEIFEYDECSVCQHIAIIFHRFIETPDFGYFDYTIFRDEFELF